MSISGIWSSFSTRQSAIFTQAQRNAAIFASGCVACPLWTPGLQSRWKRANKRIADEVGGDKRLSGHENRRRRVRGVYEFTA